MTYHFRWRTGADKDWHNVTLRLDADSDNKTGVYLLWRHFTVLYGDGNAEVLRQVLEAVHG